MFYLKRNLPSWERILRLGGAALLAVSAYAGLLPVADWISGSTAAILGLTALAGFCPACAVVRRRQIRERP
ncbi:MAG TPA: DUF2892 domain-containing protein [Noviherbaspirillum sp.]|jgi:hypothetical protein|uniref:YgaP family membrane protein n=1 Tax=Noviherbaspirillum sp. TaxID=1926288 RepID=UPI002F951869